MFVEGIDVVSGTPLLDAKPCVPGFGWHADAEIGSLEKRWRTPRSANPMNGSVPIQASRPRPTENERQKGRNEKPDPPQARFSDWLDTP